MGTRVISGASALYSAGRKVMLQGKAAGAARGLQDAAMSLVGGRPIMHAVAAATVIRPSALRPEPRPATFSELCESCGRVVQGRRRLPAGISTALLQEPDAMSCGLCGSPYIPPC